MLTSPDFKDLLNLFKKHKIRYLVVDGYAVMKYSEPRFTKDLDVFIATDEDNAKRVYEAFSSDEGFYPFYRFSQFEKKTAYPLSNS